MADTPAELPHIIDGEVNVTAVYLDHVTYYAEQARVALADNLPATARVHTLLVREYAVKAEQSTVPK
jgi:uncharacterized cupin superfamily protein